MEKTCDLPVNHLCKWYVKSNDNDYPLYKEKKYKINYLVDPLLETCENKCNADHPQMSKVVTECQRWHKE